MSSIPHHQSSASTTTRRSKTVAGWLWLLLAAGLLALLLLLGWQAAHQTRFVESAPVVMPAAMPVPAHLPKAAPRLSMDAEPVAGNPLPKYPGDVLDAGIEGDVIARLQIDSSGRVNDVLIVSHQGQQDPRLDQAAVDALLQWQFQPALREGEPIASVVQVPIEFRTGR